MTEKKAKETSPKPDRAMPVRTGQVDLGGIWAGWWFTARLNPSFGVLSNLVSSDFDLITHAFADTVIDWNLVDERGHPYQSPIEFDTRQEKIKACQAIPYDLGMEMAKAFIREVNQIPKN